MSYMVLECHPGYAVVMDGNGKFLKVANRHYTVGQTLTEVVQMQMPGEKKKQKWLTPLLTMAACLALILGVTLPRGQQPYASVYVKINPEVRIDVDRKDRVLDLEGVNQDGKDLIQGYDYHKKDLDLVTDELVDKAIDMGYLHEAGQITLTFDSSDETWVQKHSESLPHQLETYLKDKILVTIQLGELLEELEPLENLEDLEDVVEFLEPDDDHDRDDDDDLDDDDDRDDDDDLDDDDDRDDDDDLDDDDDRDDEDDDNEDWEPTRPASTGGDPDDDDKEESEDVDDDDGEDEPEDVDDDDGEDEPEDVDDDDDEDEPEDAEDDDGEDESEDSDDDDDEEETSAPVEVTSEGEETVIK